MAALVVIFTVAAATYCLRLCGLLFSNKLARGGRVKVFLDALPATLLIALVVPSLLKEGLLGAVVAALIALCIYATKSVVASMVLGVVVVALGRAGFYM